MLSTKPIQSAGSASKYYTQSDKFYSKYYFEDSEMAKTLSQWEGTGAKLMGLSGEVEPAVFEKLLHGQLPNGQQLGRKIGDKIAHRPGYDLTFSAPKSVSIMALVGGDERLIKAHQQAVTNTLKFVETFAAEARVKKGDEMQFVKTGNLTFATFLQFISRANDPQIHTHCPTLNVTQLPDGSFRALASQLHQSPGNPKGFWEQIIHYQRVLGGIYRNEFAHLVKTLGYEIVVKDGLWELKGVDKSDLSTFSQRRAAIDKFMDERGLQGAKAASLATQITRPPKTSVEPQALKARWQKTLKTEATALIADTHAALKSPQLGDDASTDAATLARQQLLTKQAVDYAIAHLSETRSTFHQLEVMNTALYGLDDFKVTSKQVAEELNARVKSGELLPLATHDKAFMFTSKQVVAHNESLLQHITDLNAKTLETKAPTRTANHQNFLHLLQKDKAEFAKALGDYITLDKHICGFEAHPSVDRLAFIQALSAVTTESDRKLLVLSQSKTHKAEVRALDCVSYIDTVAGFLHKLQNTQAVETLIPANETLVVALPEAEKLGMGQFETLMRLASNHNLRLVSVYDPKIVTAWGEKPCVNRLKDYGMHTHNLMPKADKDLMGETIRAFLPKLTGTTLEVTNKHEGLKALTQHYLGLPPTEQQQTHLLVPSLNDKQIVERALHQSLVDNGAKQVVTDILIPKAMSEAQLGFHKNFHSRQMILFHQDFKSLGVQKNEYLKVVAARVDNTVILQKLTGETLKWRLGQLAKTPDKVSVYEVTQKSFAVGERIEFLKSHPALKIASGSKWQITDIKGSQWVVSQIDTPSRHPHSPEIPQTHTLDVKDFACAHIDYAYAKSVNQSNTHGMHHAIAYVPSRARMLNQAQLYRLLAGVTGELKLITDNKALLTTRYLQASDTQPSLIQQVLNCVEAEPSDKARIQSATDESDNAAWLRPEANGQAYYGEKLPAELTHAVAQIVKASQSADKQSFQSDTQNITVNTPETIAKDAVAFSLQSIAEKEAGFSKAQLMQTALAHAVGKMDSKVMFDTFNEMEAKGVLLPATVEEYKTYYTTSQALSLEQQNQRRILAQPPFDKPFIDKQQVNNRLAHGPLTDEQKNAVRVLTLSTQRTVSIQGAPGTGKTTMMQVVDDLLSTVGVERIFLGPTHAARKELATRGLKAATLQQFLIDKVAEREATETFGAKALNIDVTQPKLYVLDEASFLSSRLAQDLLNAIAHEPARLVLVGDTKQNPSPEAGKPQVLFEKGGIPVAYLKDIRRQTNLELLASSKAAHAGDMNTAFAKLKPYIVDDVKLGLPKAENDKERKENHKARVNQVVEQYFKYDNPLVMTLTNQDRIEVSEAIRDGLKEKGALSNHNNHFSILAPNHKSQVELSRATSFNTGDVVKINRAMPGSPIGQGDYATIRDVDKNNNRLLLSGRHGQTISFSLKPFKDGSFSDLEVYTREQRDVQIGDKLRFTRSNSPEQLFGGELLTVKAIDNKALTLETAEGKTLSIDTAQEKYQHFDHAYVVTVAYAQGKTAKQSIVFAEHFHKQSANLKSFLVAVTRAKEHLTLITDDQGLLKDQVAGNPADKLSAMELRGELPLATPNVSKSPPQNVPPPNEAQNAWQAYAKMLQTTDGKPSVNATLSESSKHRHRPKTNERSASKVSQTKRWDVEDLSRRLADKSDTIVTNLLGKPKSRNGMQLRFGSNKGSLFVTVSGDKAGFWHDFQTGEGGRNLISLVQTHTGLDFKHTLEYCAGLLGIQRPDELPSLPKPTPKPPPTASLTQSQIKKRRMAQAIVAQSQPIKHTQGDAYLRTRGIKGELSDNLRFHPSVYSPKHRQRFPAIVTAVRDDKQQVQQVHLTLLDKTAPKKAHVDSAKLFLGKSPETASIELNKGDKKHDISLVAEGLETSLSLMQAYPKAQVQATLTKGNFKKIPTDTLKSTVVLCLDNDLDNVQKDKIITQACQRILATGKALWVTRPEVINAKKTDFNDVLTTQGIDKIREALARARQVNSVETDKNDVPQLTFFDTQLEHKTNFTEQPQVQQATHLNLPSTKTLQFIEQQKTNDFVQLWEKQKMKITSVNPQKLAEHSQVNSNQFSQMSYQNQMPAAQKTFGESPLNANNSTQKFIQLSQNQALQTAHFSKITYSDHQIQGVSKAQQYELTSPIKHLNIDKSLTKTATKSFKNEISLTQNSLQKNFEIEL